MPIDRARLVTFLHQRENATQSVVLQAVYAGLDARIARGDFDLTETAPESAGTLHRDLDNHLPRRRSS